GLPPLPQDSGGQPFRKPEGPSFHGRAGHLSAQELMRQSDHARNPVSVFLFPSKTPIPVKIGGPVFHHQTYITQPQWAPPSVIQKMQTDKTQVIFRARNTYIDAIKRQ